MKKLAFVLTFLLPCLGQQPQPTPSPVGGTVNGTLTGDDGALISAAIVGLALLPPYPVDRLRQSEWAAVSAADGSFQFDHLVNGNYEICAQAPSTAWLNTCEWGLQPTVVSLGSDQPSATIAVVLKKGALVPIRLADPGGLLSRYESTIPTANVLIGVSNDAYFFRRASITSADATGRNYQIVIPFGVAVNLVVCTSFFQLSNAGVALPKGSASIPITVQPGQQAATVALVVTGGGSQ